MGYKTRAEAEQFIQEAQQSPTSPAKPSGPRSGTRCYAVRGGPYQGVYDSWPEAYVRSQGVHGSTPRRCNSREEALEWIHGSTYLQYSSRSSTPSPSSAGSSGLVTWERDDLSSTGSDGTVFSEGVDLSQPELP
ncbi:hypothetical protein CALVIDRAFT_216411 [Calocera viscosa TUFC12733]|uniref:Ribonuclease H1 N-terminal domain-containing protein n=1 Tax=Calocera viscosa (strain TUFC12733) TaxID=1330018 RepID=A0A167RGN2_CALVF|nr:hypothetical protein CALVIDRAFT_216411 [Calocera viscosa TUFC12733]